MDGEASINYATWLPEVKLSAVFRSRLLIFALAASVVGCIGAVPHTTARAVPAGDVELSAYLGAWGAPDRDTGFNGKKTDQVAFTHGVSARVGLATFSDFGLSFDVPGGFVADVKFELLDSDVVSLALDPAIGATWDGELTVQLALLVDIAFLGVRATLGPRWALFGPDQYAGTTAEVEIQASQHFYLVPGGLILWAVTPDPRDPLIWAASTGFRWRL